MAGVGGTKSLLEIGMRSLHDMINYRIWQRAYVEVRFKCDFDLKEHISDSVQADQLYNLIDAVESDVIVCMWSKP